MAHRFYGHLIQSTFPEIKECGWHSCISSGNAFQCLMTECNATTRPKAASHQVTAYLHTVCKRWGARRYWTRSSSNSSKRRSKATHISTQIIPAQLQVLPQGKAYFILLTHHWKARHPAADESAQSNRWMGGVTGRDAALSSGGHTGATGMILR